MVEDKDRRARILERKKGYRQNHREEQHQQGTEEKYLTKERKNREVRKPEEDSHGGQEGNFYHFPPGSVLPSKMPNVKD